MKRRYRVRCKCGWTGVRTAQECECYDMPCSPLWPGMGCPSGVVYPCPKCGRQPYGRLVQRRLAPPVVPGGES